MKSVSYGVALCRRNPKSRAIEILLIRKRYSYHFFAFVYGYYQKSNMRQLQNMFNNMTPGEKVDILGMQFSNMWYRIGLNNPEKGFDLAAVLANRQIGRERNNQYYTLKTKFHQNFNDKSTLRHLIENSTDAELIWEIPKGHRHGGAETHTDCAMREFQEETSIGPSEYKIFYDVRPVVDCHTDEGTEYYNIYYLAEPKGEIVPSINFFNHEQIIETEQLRWCTMDELRFLRLPPKTHARTMDVYRRIIRAYKKTAGRK